MGRRKAINGFIKEQQETIIGPQLPSVTDRSKDIEECNVPMEFIAAKMHINIKVLRSMIRQGMFQFATFRIIKSKTIFYCSSKLLYEQRGIIYNGN